MSAYGKRAMLVLNRMSLFMGGLSDLINIYKIDLLSICQEPKKKRCGENFVKADR